MPSFHGANAAEPETIYIGGPATNGPAVNVDYGAIEEALGRTRPDFGLKLHPPGQKGAAKKSAPKLKLPGMAQAAHQAAPAPKKDKLPPIAPVATESTGAPSLGVTASAVPTAPVARTALETPKPAVTEAKPEPVKPEPAKPETAKAEPAKPEPAKQGPAKQEPVKLAPEAAKLAAEPPKTEPAKPDVKIATAPPPAPAAAKAVEPKSGNDLRLLFQSENDALSDDGKQVLDKIADKLKVNDARAQIIAYAAGTADQSSAARRLSLKRALSVREYLIAKGIRSQRMDLRALGNETGEGPPDRVDIVFDGR
jgi:outer membrane protein OmpA-like peptidoglycan-associated protein